MTAKRMSLNYRKSKGEFEKSKIDGREKVRKNQYTFCKKDTRRLIVQKSSRRRMSLNQRPT